MDPVQEQLDAYNARDLERFLACYHPDAVVEDSAGAGLAHIHPRSRARAHYHGLYRHVGGLCHSGAGSTAEGDYRD
jgi:hypothetical protein